MDGRIKRFLAVAAVGAIVGLGAGGYVLGDRVIYAAPDDPPTTGITMPCGGPGGMGRLGGMMGLFNSVTLDKIAKLTGISTEDLTTKLQQGSSLVETTQGKATEQQLVDILVAPHKETMALRVQQGYLTQQQADQMIEQMTLVAKNAVNSKYESGSGYGPRGMHGGPGAGTGFRGGPGGMMGGNNWS